MDYIGIHLDAFDEESLMREVGMMRSARTPNELVDLELEAIDQLAKRGEYK
ncbi:hypothetical protein AB1K09_19895 [Solibacillus silvestris]